MAKEDLNENADDNNENDTNEGGEAGAGDQGDGGGDVGEGSNTEADDAGEGDDGGSDAGAETVESLTAKVKDLGKENRALKKQLKQAQGTFDDERTAFEAERTKFEAGKAELDTTLKGVVKDKLAILPEKAQKAIKAKSKDPRQQLDHIQLLLDSGLGEAALPAEVSQCTAGGGTGGKHVPKTSADLRRKERSGSYSN